MEEVLNLGTELDFGKYKGYTVQEVIRLDKSYIQWLAEDGKLFTDAVEAEL